MNFKIKIKKSLKKNFFAFTKILPLFFGIILLMSLVKNVFGFDFYTKFVTNNIIIDSFTFNIIGSIMVGNALNSYIISQNMLLAGISFYLVIVFMLAWVTVGIVQLPAESILLGKRFAIIRNLVAFFSNFLVAFIVVLLLEVL